MTDIHDPDKINRRELLIKILSEWAVTHGPGRGVGPGEKYTVPEFMATMDILAVLKNVKNEQVIIKAREKH